MKCPIADIIQGHANQNGLNVTYDVPTTGDGNCWYRAIVQQIQHRPEVKSTVHSQFHTINHELLRLAVVYFVQHNQISNACISRYRALKQYTVHGYNTWEEFLSKQATNGVYATALFCMATAVLLQINIHVTSEQCTRAQPYNCISKNWEVGCSSTIATTQPIRN